MSGIPERGYVECGCPPWVEPCAHYEGRAIGLISSSDPVDCCDTHKPAQPGLYVVAEYRAVSQNENCGCYGLQSPMNESVVYDTRDAARAEFRRRAAQLIGDDA